MKIVVLVSSELCQLTGLRICRRDDVRRHRFYEPNANISMLTCWRLAGNLFVHKLCSESSLLAQQQQQLQSSAVVSLSFAKQELYIQYIESILSQRHPGKDLCSFQTHLPSSPMSGSVCFAAQYITSTQHLCISLREGVCSFDGTENPPFGIS